jgi:hypothetical protein
VSGQHPCHERRREGKQKRTFILGQKAYAVYKGVSIALQERKTIMAILGQVIDVSILSS